MADEFDIDIYGDLNPDEPTTSAPATKKEEEDDQYLNDNAEVKQEQKNQEDTDMGASAPDGDNSVPIKEEGQPCQSKQKRKLDDRPYDPNATSALYIADLQWWTTDDDIRGWVRSCDCEDELKDITFSEHKVNGKSKGVAFVEFTTPQAAAAVKAKIESGSNQPAYMGKRHSVNYTNPNTNPFRTLPKDAPQRDRPRDFQAGRGTGAPHSAGPVNAPIGAAAGAMGMNAGMPMGGFRGGRGGFSGPVRGGMGAPFMGGRGGFAPPVQQGSPQQGFQTPMGGFGNPNMPMQQFGAGNFQGGNFRGGMNQMRGGPNMRGRGMGGPMMGGGMGMGGNMGGMGMSGNMGGMGMGGGNMDGSGFNPMGNMGGFGMGAGPGGFPTPHFNPAFFQGQQGGGQGQWGDNNPHPAKRARPNE
ncbi:hypothetical protein EX30DRAFT_51481 [Ascodesmis nigricans]|uniref:RRM domain-containing protein n=1 Tax=Ascodesmis nigricans TaxID=341454 RepID=A0A4S2MV67_9PEZI|nr:hypothetical protein EX30DRAFT_51481 [Ascodesmis nigricans]